MAIRDIVPLLLAAPLILVMWAFMGLAIWQIIKVGFRR